jgi:acyl CoA:acetate/3-ketoacid CoA transferase beta subunit
LTVPHPPGTITLKSDNTLSNVAHQAVFDVDPKKGLTLIEVAANTTVDEVKKKTDAPFQVAKDLKKFGDEDESGGKPKAKL